MDGYIMQALFINYVVDFCLSTWMFKCHCTFVKIMPVEKILSTGYILINTSSIPSTNIFMKLKLYTHTTHQISF